jgi:hypothetical protein
VIFEVLKAVTTNTTEFWKVTSVVRYNFTGVVKRRIAFTFLKLLITQFSIKSHHLIPNIALSTFFSNNP